MADGVLVLQALGRRERDRESTWRIKARLQQGRAEQPSAGIIDSPSVKGADTVGADSRGYDAGKKVNGRKRFIVTDTAGLLVTVAVMAASWQDETLAWLTACRRLARDYERHPETSEAIIRWAAIAGMARRITRGRPARRTFIWT